MFVHPLSSFYNSPVEFRTLGSRLNAILSSFSRATKILRKETVTGRRRESVGDKLSVVSPTLRVTRGDPAH